MKPFVTLRPRTKPVSIMLTALVDIFLVVLLFLLQTFATDQTMQSVPAGIRLPQAVGSAQAPNSLRIEVGKDVYAIEGRGFTVKANARGELTEEEEQRLVRLFLEVRQLQPEYHSIALLADGQTPFSKLQPLIKAAEAVGLTQWTLVVAGSPK